MLWKIISFACRLKFTYWKTLSRVETRKPLLCCVINPTHKFGLWIFTQKFQHPSDNKKSTKPLSMRPKKNVYHWCGVCFTTPTFGLLFLCSGFLITARSSYKRCIRSRTNKYTPNINEWMDWSHSTKWSSAAKMRGIKYAGSISSASPAPLFFLRVIGADGWNSC